MTDEFSLLQDHLAKIYSENPFVTLLQIKLVELRSGSAELSMPVNSGKHTNLYNIAHGGALASLADTAMGIACATTGKKVVTLDMNLNYLQSVKCQPAITAVASLIHNGRQTMVAEADIFDSTRNLLVKARATFFVTGSFL